MADDYSKSQQELSFNEFIARYGTEEQCFDAFFQWRWPDGFHCPNCGHDRHCQLVYRKLLQCNRCRRQTSVTAGSVLDSTKLPLTLWFQALYLLTRDSKPISVMALHRRLRISYNAAWRMKRTLMQATSDGTLPVRL